MRLNRGKHWKSRCGRVQLYLGDCLKILPKLAANSVDLIVTDPPYGHNNNNNGDLISRLEAALGRGVVGPPRPIANDGPEANGIFQRTLLEYRRILKPGCCCCCCGGGGPDPQFARWSLWLDQAIGFKQMIVWDKGPMGLGWHYRRSYETVLVAQKKGAPCNWQGGHSVENVIRPGAHGIKKIIPKQEDHPCAKPVALYEAFIRWHTRPGELVLDPFMGHGPCGLAALALGRQFIGIECDADHFERAIARIKATLKQPRLIAA